VKKTLNKKFIKPLTFSSFLEQFFRKILSFIMKSFYVLNYQFSIKIKTSCKVTNTLQEAYIIDQY
ncbi:hypothetical protein LLE82_07670, partial [Staphylococcus epidermidis]|nr:hypothetical protein [Staphylococcus epidermidis]